MFLGRVIGSVWATVKWPEVEGLKLLTVRPHHLSDLAGGDAAAGACHDLVVCGDVLGAGVGEDVVIAYGHAARVALSGALGFEEQPSIPVDAAVVAIVDQMDVDAEALAAAVERGDERTS